MSRIQKLSKSEVTGDVLAIFEKAGAERGNVPNLFRIYVKG